MAVLGIFSWGHGCFNHNFPDRPEYSPDFNWIDIVHLLLKWNVFCAPRSIYPFYLWEVFLFYLILIQQWILQSVTWCNNSRFLAAIKIDYFQVIPNRGASLESMPDCRLFWNLKHELHVLVFGIIKFNHQIIVIDTQRNRFGISIKRFGKCSQLYDGIW